MAEIQDYINLIPGYNRNKPKFIAWLTVALTPLVALINLANNMTNLFSVTDAVGPQLDIVGLWVGVKRQISVPLSGVFFSFNTAGLGFNQGIWLGPLTPSTGLISLDDFHYRFLIQAKIAANNWDGTALTAEAAYALAFQGNPGVQVEIIDHGNMSFTVNIDGPITALQQTLITGGYLPLKPMSMAVNYTTNNSDNQMLSVGII